VSLEVRRTRALWPLGGCRWPRVVHWRGQTGRGRGWIERGVGVVGALAGLLIVFGEGEGVCVCVWR